MIRSNNAAEPLAAEPALAVSAIVERADVRCRIKDAPVRRVTE